MDHTVTWPHVLVDTILGPTSEMYSPMDQCLEQMNQ